MKRPKNYVRASQINKNPRLMHIQKQKIIRIDKSKLHLDRWHYCLSMLMRDLLKLKDKRIERLFDKYHCVVMDESVGLLFPENVNDRDLPKHLRLK